MITKKYKIYNQLFLKTLNTHLTPLFSFNFLDSIVNSYILMQINKINNKNRKNTLTTPILDVSSPSISLLAPLLPSKRQISIFENPSIKEKENISNNRNSLTELSNKETLISPKKK